MPEEEQKEPEAKLAPDLAVISPKTIDLNEENVRKLLKPMPAEVKSETPDRVQRSGHCGSYVSEDSFLFLSERRKFSPKKQEEEG